MLQRVSYNKYYQSENLFGEPYPELINFYSTFKNKGRLLDLGCGQGRDAIALARLGFKVTGIDHSEVGINQLNKIAKKERLPLVGVVADIFEYSSYEGFPFILLDSMFHFGKKEKEQELKLLNRIIDSSDSKAMITICIQQSEKKLKVLHSIIDDHSKLTIVDQTEFLYKFIDKESNHNSKSMYEMITIQKTH